MAFPISRWAHIISKCIRHLFLLAYIACLHASASDKRVLQTHGVNEFEEGGKQGMQVTSTSYKHSGDDCPTLHLFSTGEYKFCPIKIKYYFFRCYTRKHTRQLNISYHTSLTRLIFEKSSSDHRNHILDAYVLRVDYDCTRRHISVKQFWWTVRGNFHCSCYFHMSLFDDINWWQK